MTTYFQGPVPPSESAPETNGWTQVQLTPAPVEVRTVNASGEKLFPQEASPGGCASGECLPDEVDANEPLEVPDLPPPVRRSPGFTPEAWRLAVDKVRAASPRHGASLAFGRLVHIAPGEVRLAYPREAGFHRTTITAQSGRLVIEKILAEHFGVAMKMLVEEGEGAGRAAPSIAEQEQQSRVAHEKSTDAKVRTHPAMRAVLKMLGGEIEHIQVLDRERPAAVDVEPVDDGG